MSTTFPPMFGSYESAPLSLESPISSVAGLLVDRKHPSIGIILGVTEPWIVPYGLGVAGVLLHTAVAMGACVFLVQRNRSSFAE